MEQILINLITGALGGVAVGKSSPTFDLGMIGNIIAGFIRACTLAELRDRRRMVVATRATS